MPSYEKSDGTNVAAFKMKVLSSLRRGYALWVNLCEENLEWIASAIDVAWITCSKKRKYDNTDLFELASPCKWKRRGVEDRAVIYVDYQKADKSWATKEKRVPIPISMSTAFGLAAPIAQDELVTVLSDSFPDEDDGACNDAA